MVSPPISPNLAPRAETFVSLPVGVVVERRPGVTRWVREVFRPVAVLSGAPEADWKLLREDGATRTYHAATVPLVLHRSEVEAYKVSLAMTPPSVFVVMRPVEGAGRGAMPYAVHAVTASAYEAQDYTDSGEELVEPVPMPAGLVAFVRDFADAHYVETPFIKRQRDRRRAGDRQDGIGDKRIRQGVDVYRVPHQKKPEQGA